MAKPQIIAVNKVDLPEVRAREDALRAQFLDEVDAEVFFISAATGEGIDSLLDRVFQEAVILRGPKPSGDLAPNPPLLRPKARREPLKIQKEGQTYVVQSSATVRVAPMVDRDSWEARMQFHGLLKQMGVTRALEKAGIVTGDTVRFGRVEWKWE